MFDDPQTPSDSLDDGIPPAELEKLERRLILDGSLWRADVPADAKLAELASTLPGGADRPVAEEGSAVPVLDTHAVASAAIDIPHHPYRQPPPLIAVAATMVVVLLLALVLTTFAHGPGATVGNSTATRSADSTGTATGVSTTAAPTTTGGSGGTASPGYVPLQVTGLSLSVNRSSVNGICQDDNYFNFTLTITIAPGSEGGSVGFNIVPSDSTINGISKSSTLFGGGAHDTSQNFYFDEDIPAQAGDGTNHWVQVQTTSPNAVSSPKVNFAATCVRQVTSVTASVTPNVWNAPCASTRNFTFTFTITLTPGPPFSLTVNVNSSGGFGDADPQPPQTFTHNTGDLISWSEPNFLYSPAGGDGDGTYWQSMTVTSPNSMTSNQATITDAC